MTRELAKQILQLDFPESDHFRMAELSTQAGEGALSVDEKQELETYVEASHLIALLQSKARMFLRGDSSK